MGIISKIIYYIKKPSRILLYLDNHNFIHMSDENYIKLEYKTYTGKKLNLDNPKSYNEKLQWLKLHDRRELYTKLVDKAEVKEYVSNLIGENYIIKTIGVYDSFDEIDFANLPNQFVIKCTHDSGGVVICKDKNNFDVNKAKKYINKRLKLDYFKMHREWPYKNVKPRIIIEQYMEDSNSRDLKDYKFFVFDGIIKCVQVDYDRFTNHKRAFYDNEWKRLKFTTCYPTDYSIDIDKPTQFDEMKKIVEKISLNVDNPAFVRIDLYNINGKVYFGEITFYHGAGYEKFEPEEWDYKLGEYIDLESVEK